MIDDLVKTEKLTSESPKKGSKSFTVKDLFTVSIFTTGKVIRFKTGIKSSGKTPLTNLNHVLTSIRGSSYGRRQAGKNLAPILFNASSLWLPSKIAKEPLETSKGSSTIPSFSMSLEILITRGRIVSS